MREILKSLRGCKLIARGWEGKCEVLHYLLPDGKVLQIIRQSKEDCS